MSELEQCHGLQPTSTSVPHRRFALPGDRPVWGRDRPFKVEHLQLRFEFDLRRREVRGVATTRFHPRRDGLTEAVFDAIELDIESVSGEDGQPFAYTTRERELRVQLGDERSAGEAITVVVRYRCRPRRGLYFNAPDPGYPDRPTQIWTQGQAEDSAYYFPCLDFPGEKFTSEVIATVPRGWTVVSNGRLQAVDEDTRRRRATFHWTQEIPHPAYLIMVAAGEFDVVEDRADSVRVQYYGAKGSAEAMRRAWGRTPEMVSFFADRIGVPYPWAKYATLSIADFIFGGMENTSATIMVDTYLHDERTAPDLDEECDSLAAHELAHQWFGDLVTCREWSHGWLNESFATYFDGLFVEHHRGHDAFRYNVYANTKSYFDEDRDAYRRPLVENVYRAPIDVFDSHLYERGSVVLDMLRSNLGDDLWWRAIHHYVVRHRERDVLTHDFQRAIEGATGRNMDWFFAQWVWKGGHPEFKATYAWDAARRLASVSLNQTQQADDLTSIYRTPIEIGFMTEHGYQRYEREVVDAAHTFVFPFDAEPLFVSIDPAGKVLRTLDFAPGEHQLMERLAGEPEVIGRIEAAKGLAKLGTLRAIDALRGALLNDRELWFVRAEIAEALGGAKSESARDALVDAIATEPPRVRRAVAKALGDFTDEVAAAALAGLLRGRGDPSYYVQAAAAAALGKTRQRSALRRLTTALGRPSHNAVIMAGALTGLGRLRDAKALPLLLEHVRWGVPQNARRAATAALGELAPHLEAGPRLQVREQLETLLEDRWYRVQFAAIEALKTVRDADAIPALARLEARALEGRLQRNARVAMAALRERSDRADDVRTLGTQLEEVRQDNQKLRDRLAAVEAQIERRAKP
ncbi:MAG: M1 family aminopeptidase [Chloroflexi bacterium]|nr:M1 family aminopeptidase [Chloroflexota bacterium]MDA1002606.1 M1 family aminopeptidase [Chloroflexota bacterium]